MWLVALVMLAPPGVSVSEHKCSGFLARGWLALRRKNKPPRFKPELSPNAIFGIQSPWCAIVESQRSQAPDSRSWNEGVALGSAHTHTKEHYIIDTAARRPAAISLAYAPQPPGFWEVRIVYMVLTS